MCTFVHQYSEAMRLAKKIKIMATIFLKLANDHNNEGKYFAMSQSQIETLNVSDSYDQYGQKVSASDAGDYLELTDRTAAQFANDCYNEQEDNEDDDRENPYSAGMNINAFDNSGLFEAVCDEPALGVVTHRTQFQGFNFWDGSNWKTVSVETIEDNNEYEIETDETIIARLKEAIENKEQFSEGFGLTTYRYKDVEIVESQFASAWEQYEITLDNDFNEEY